MSNGQKNPEIWKNLKKIIIFFFWKNNAVFLVLPNEVISLPPEISSPPRFRIHVGFPERYGAQKSLCLILDSTMLHRHIIVSGDGENNSCVWKGVLGTGGPYFCGRGGRLT